MKKGICLFLAGCFLFSPSVFAANEDRLIAPGASAAVVDAKAHTVLATIKLTGELARPMGAVASPDGKWVYVTTGRGKMLVAIDTTTHVVAWSVEVGQRPWGVAISPDGSTVYTANGPSNDISIVDVAARSVVGRVKAGDRPWGAAIAP